MNLTNDFKRVLSGMLSVAMTATLVQSIPAIAEDAQITNIHMLFSRLRILRAQLLLMREIFV